MTHKLLETIIETSELLKNNLHTNKPELPETTTVINNYGYNPYFLNPPLVIVDQRKSKEDRKRNNSFWATIGFITLALTATYMFANDYNKFKFSTRVDELMDKMKSLCLGFNTEGKKYIAKFMKVDQAYNKWNKFYGGSLARFLYPKITGVTSAAIGLAGLYISNYNIEMAGLFGTVGSLCWYMWNYITTDETKQNESLSDFENSLKDLYTEVYENTFPTTKK